MMKSYILLFLCIFILIFSCSSEKEETPVMAKVGETVLTLEQISTAIGFKGDTLSFNEDRDLPSMSLLARNCILSNQVRW